MEERLTACKKARRYLNNDSCLQFIKMLRFLWLSCQSLVQGVTTPSGHRWEFLYFFYPTDQSQMSRNQSHVLTQCRLSFRIKNLSKAVCVKGQGVWLNGTFPLLTMEKTKYRKQGGRPPLSYNDTDTQNEATRQWVSRWKCKHSGVQSESNVQPCQG